MHMSDALVSPAVAGACWATTAVILSFSAWRLQRTTPAHSAARMGIMGAFVFASQMINFAIPGTGSSGHLGGGLLLAIVLGPCSAVLSLASVLFLQALFFADGGLLAWGANTLNLGFFTCFVAFPFVFKPVAGSLQTRNRIVFASLLAALVGSELGALAVTLETWFSGISALPLSTFIALMLPVHAAIGTVEGLLTAGVVLFLMQTTPELLPSTAAPTPASATLRHRMAAFFATGIVILGCFFSLFASRKPDGLEWSLEKLTKQKPLEEPTSLAHQLFQQIQQRLAIFPDYHLPNAAPHRGAPTPKQEWPAVDPQTSLSGLVGGTFVFLFIAMWALGLRTMQRRKQTRA